MTESAKKILLRFSWRPASIIIFTYLSLLEILPEENPRPELIIELLDEQNEPLFPLDKEDVIVSPRLVGQLLAQVSLRRELAAVINELAQPSGAQILLQPAQEYLETSGSVKYADLESAAAARSQIALGWRRTQGTDSSVTLNPDRKLEWELAAGDEIVVLASYTEKFGE